MILETLTNYYNGVNSAKEDFEKAKANLFDFNPEGTIYANKMRIAKEDFDSRTEEAKTTALDEIRTALDEAKAKATACVTKPVPAELASVLPIYGKLSDLEKEVIMQKYSGNYIAVKLLNEANGERSFSSVEKIIGDLDELSVSLHEAIEHPEHEYNRRLMLKGDWIQRVETEVSEFVSKYSE